MQTELARYRKLEGLARGRAASLQSRRSGSPLIELKRTLRGPKRLRPKHLDIARRVVLGQPHDQIARETNLSTDVIHVICRTPIFQSQVDALQQQVQHKFVEEASLSPVRQRIEDEQMGSVERLTMLRDNALKEDVQFKSARTLLEAGGNMQPSEEARGTGELSREVVASIAIGLRDVQLYIQTKNGKKQ